MMQRKQLIPLILALAGAAQAAELGDIAPRSYIGQPLAVDIELVSLTPEEALNLPVRLAQADVYRAANAAINPALASVRMQVDKRGQKQVLHVTTTRAVEAEYLHLYVELGVPGKSEVRLATVWLQRDPNPPPPPAPVVAAVAQPVAQSIPPASAMTPVQAEQIAAQARAARAAAAAEAAKVEAAKVEAAKVEAAKAEATRAEAAAVRERAKPAPLPSVHEAETGRPGEVKAAGQARRIAGVLVGSDGKPVAPSAREEAAEVPVGVAQALLPLAPLPLPKGVKRPAPASCAPTGMSAKECVALDARNTEMAGKITELEGKLKALQGALGGAAPTATAAHAAPLAPSAASVVPAAKPGTPGGPAAGKAAATGASPAAKPGAQAGGAAGPATPAASTASRPDASPAAAKNGAAAPAAGAASAAAGHAASSGAAEKGTKMASASLSAQGETEAHAAKAEGASASASASAASGEAAASAASAAASVPTKQVRVLPKLKYKKEKEKPAEQSSSTLPLIGGGIGLLALLGGGFVVLRKRSAGAGPLKIWQGFRKKQAAQPAPEPVAEPAPESVA
jgi:pilus assembly protein FimV